MNQLSDVTTTDSMHGTRRNLRYAAAVLSAVTAVIYLLIGFRAVSVIDNTTDQYFGFFAAAGYLLGVVLLLAFERRWVWILGAVLQVFVIFTYFNLAPQRTPVFETWGIVLRIVQVLILVTLAYLAFRVPQPAEHVRRLA